MHFEYVAMRLVQPRDDNNFIANSNAFKTFYDGRMQFEPCVRRAFMSLVGGGLAIGQIGANDPDGFDCIARFNHCSLPLRVALPVGNGKLSGRST